MSKKKQKKISIFIHHSGRYFYAFIFIIIGFFINEISSETNLHKLIKISEKYHVENKYKENSIVHLTDILRSQGTVSDNEFIFEQENIIILKKTVEMYLWRLRPGKNSHYVKGWESQYINSSNFLISKFHENPKPTRELGIFYFYPSSVHLGKIQLPIQNFKSDSYQQFRLKNSVKNERNYLYIFLGVGTIDNPEIGDTRIRYQVYKSNQSTTIFGTILNKKLSFSNNENYTSFYDKNLFQTLYKGDITNVITSFLKNEESWKNLINNLLSFALFFIIFKFTIVIYNMIVIKDIESDLKRYSILFLVILPISVISTYLITQAILLGLRYF